MSVQFAGGEHVEICFFLFLFQQDLGSFGASLLCFQVKKDQTEIHGILSSLFLSHKRIAPNFEKNLGKTPGVPNQQMQMMGGYNVANVANVPAMVGGPLWLEF